MMDELKLFFGDDYVINNYISLKHPRINDIIDMGENEYFAMIHLFTTIPSDIKPFLYDNFQIIWEDISEFECFLRFFWPQVTSEYSQRLFGDLDLTQFQVEFNPNTQEFFLYQYKNNELIVIDSRIYMLISDALRLMHGQKKKAESAASKTVQRILIDDDRAKQKRAAEKRDKEGNKSSLLPLISSLINCSDFKYGLEEIRKMPIYAFMDSVSRVQIIRNSTALLQGCYSGMIDTKKIDKNELNFMREIKKS